MATILRIRDLVDSWIALLHLTNPTRRGELEALAQGGNENAKAVLRLTPEYTQVAVCRSFGALASMIAIDCYALGTRILWIGSSARGKDL